MPNFSDDDSAYPNGEETPVTERINWNRPNAPTTPGIMATRARMQQQKQNKMEEAARAFQEAQTRAFEETQAQYALMHEARLRFAKASLYEQILADSVFEGSNDPVTAEVNAEFRDFAQKQLCALLGIKNESVSDEPRLDSEQIEVLSMFANSLLQRKDSILKKDDVKPISVPSSPPPPPEVGRLAKRKTRPHQTTKPAPTTPIHSPVTTAIPVQPQQMTLPLDPIGTTEPNRGLAQVLPPKTPNVPKPIPMPSPEDQITLAAFQGENGLRNHQSRLVEETASKQ